METNESIATKGVVSIDDRKLVGKVKGVIVDCDTCGISYYIVSSSSTNSSLVLPFEKSLAVGDTFMTIQSRDDFLATTDSTAKGILEDKFDLVGLDVYSRVGSHLGVIKGFDIDTTFGAVTKIDLEDGSSFCPDAYVFFARDFVFVDDGTKTDAELRAAASEGADEDEERAERAESAPMAEPADEEETIEPDSTEEDVEEEIEVEEDVAEDEGSVEEFEAESSAEEEDEEKADEDPDAELRSFLLGKKLNERVVSKDGSFVLEAGEEITEKAFADAQTADAVLLLAMSVDE